jgi:hypothetical protein
MTDLSPAAQAVLDAFLDTPGYEPLPDWDYKRDIAAALRAAADQMGSHQSKKFLYSIADAMKLRDIAAELDNSAQPS